VLDILGQLFWVVMLLVGIGVFAEKMVRWWRGERE
jgi:hypothetical protein